MMATLNYFLAETTSLILLVLDRVKTGESAPPTQSPDSTPDMPEEHHEQGYFERFIPLEFLHIETVKHPWTALLLGFTMTLFLVFLKRSRKHQPPGPWPWPVIGHVNYFRNKPHIRLSNLKDVYGDVYRLSAGPYNIVVVCSLEGILEGLMQKGQVLSGRPDFEALDIIYDGDRNKGLSTADFDEMTQMKKTFLDSSLDAYCSNSDSIEDVVAADILETINRFVEAEEPLDPFILLECACLNIMSRLTYGQRFDPCGRAMQEILSTFHARNFAKYCFHSVDYVPFLKAFKPRVDLDFINDKTANQIDYQRKILNLHKDSYDPANIRDLMDHLLLYLETGEDKGLMEKDVIDYLLLDFASSGYETTAVVLTWLLGYMAAHPDIQAQVQEELDSVVGNDRLLSLQDQPFLPYTSAVVFEAERLVSVLPFLQAHVAEEDCKLQDFDISEGSIVLFNVWSVHHDTRYWRRPMNFDPHRFLTAEKTLEIPDHFMPYGAGPRRCPGESLAEINLFLFFGTIMHQLSVKPTVKDFHVQGDFDFLMRPNPFKLKFEER